MTNLTVDVIFQILVYLKEFLKNIGELASVSSVFAKAVTHYKSMLKLASSFEDKHVSIKSFLAPGDNNILIVKFKNVYQKNDDYCVIGNENTGFVNVHFNTVYEFYTISCVWDKTSGQLMAKICVIDGNQLEDLTVFSAKKKLEIAMFAKEIFTSSPKQTPKHKTFLMDCSKTLDLLNYTENMDRNSLRTVMKSKDMTEFLGHLDL